MRLFEFTEEKGSYAAVKFDPETTKALEAFQYDNEIQNPLNPDEFHSTVMWSRKYIPNFKVMEGPLSWEGRFKEFTIFPSDEDNALVLLYDCPELTERHFKIRSEYGATWDYPDFIPHITLSYNVGDLDPKSLPAYDGPITIVSEYADDADANWANDKK